VKLPLVCALAFVAGLGGSTGMVMARGNPAADSTAAAAHPDSAKAGEHTDSTAAAAPHDTTATPAAAHDSVAHDSTAKPAAAHGDSASPEHAAKPVAAILHALKDSIRPDFPRLARLMSTMPMPLAVERIALLTDAEVEGILRALGMRQAAALLAGMPKERAAILARRLLVPKDTGSSKP
jgi:hypothetical protein